MNKLTEWLTKPFLEEDINLPVKVGDTIFTPPKEIHYLSALSIDTDTITVGRRLR